MTPFRPFGALLTTGLAALAVGASTSAPGARSVPGAPDLLYGEAVIRPIESYIWFRVRSP